MKRIKPIPSNLSAEEWRTYRRWTAGLFISYMVAVTLVVGITYFTRPATDPDAPNMTQMARLKPVSGSIAVAPEATVARP